MVQCCGASLLLKQPAAQALCASAAPVALTGYLVDAHTPGSHLGALVGRPAAVEQPLAPDTAAAYRAVLRRCCALRAQKARPRPPAWPAAHPHSAELDPALVWGTGVRPPPGAPPGAAMQRALPRARAGRTAVLKGSDEAQRRTRARQTRADDAELSALNIVIAIAGSCFGQMG